MSWTMRSVARAGGLAIAALVLAGCAGLARGRPISWLEAQSITPGVSARWVMAEHPFPALVVRGTDGRIRRLQYAVIDPRGARRTVELVFDGEERMAFSRGIDGVVPPDGG